MTLAYIKNMNRKQLVAYLEGWGYRCYSTETTAQLRAAAIANFKTEGA